MVVVLVLVSALSRVWHSPSHSHGRGVSTGLGFSLFAGPSTRSRLISSRSASTRLRAAAGRRVSLRPGSSFRPGRWPSRSTGISLSPSLSLSNSPSRSFSTSLGRSPSPSPGLTIGLSPLIGICHSPGIGLRPGRSPRIRSH